MSGKPPEPPSTGPDQGDRDDDPGERSGSERAGPLTVERLRKGDGRALILYTLGRESADA